MDDFYDISLKLFLHSLFSKVSLMILPCNLYVFWFSSDLHPSDLVKYRLFLITYQMFKINENHPLPNNLPNE